MTKTKKFLSVIMFVSILSFLLTNSYLNAQVEDTTNLNEESNGWFYAIYGVVGGLIGQVVGFIFGFMFGYGATGAFVGSLVGAILFLLSGDNLYDFITNEVVGPLIIAYGIEHLIEYLLDISSIIFNNGILVVIISLSSAIGSSIALKIDTLLMKEYPLDEKIFKPGIFFGFFLGLVSGSILGALCGFLFEMGFSNCISGALSGAVSGAVLGFGGVRMSTIVAGSFVSSVGIIVGNITGVTGEIFGIGGLFLGLLVCAGVILGSGSEIGIYNLLKNENYTKIGKDR